MTEGIVGNPAAFGGFMVKVTISTEEGRALVEHLVQPEPAETDEHLAEDISEMIQINYDVKDPSS